MGDPALAKSNNPLSIEGLEDVFDTSELASESSEATKGTYITGSEPGSAAQNPEEEPGSELVDTQSVEIVSTEEAARRLGISSRAIIKRLKNGSLRGYRDDSKQRAEWKIYWNEPGSEPKGTSSSKAVNDGTGSFNGTSDQESTGTSSFNRTSDPKDVGTGSSSYLVDLNKRLLEQVQALTYQNGFLESQLLERQRDITKRDEALKLLTDSQHKRGWFQRFSSWFLGHQ